MNLGRKFLGVKFKLFNLKTIQDIPTEKFNEILESCLSDGWKKIYEYDGHDAWIDHGKVVLDDGQSKLNFEWDNWCEGAITGPEHLVEKIAQKYALKSR